ncbi:type II toxin-antitoxin system mRNA interferase toxin, RelE/StbE family [Arachidicoccus soli]|uniref:Type II toxin-antitoxin system mRNA interferase toxin, RelE/StbE family n=1 Tax=Arachidicoccus soli TaxID=2341117 RepID=A0A386HNW9_9BACT|nr:type II toxin-antitoxin system mRNA interferase toxin, RelE/StbE family [Arachidicoccus soli]
MKNGTGHISFPGGEYSNCWECHVKSDLLIIWREFEEELIIELVRAGTHSDLFG